MSEPQCQIIAKMSTYTDRATKPRKATDPIEPSPPAKRSKQATVSKENSSVGPSNRQKSNYASEMFHRQYLNERLADVFFTFKGANERVPAHKFVLSSASSVFERMFYGKSAVTGDIPIVGHSPEAFKEFLQFCYLDEITLKPNNIKDVIRLLFAYEMPKCIQIFWDVWNEKFNDFEIDDICLAYDCALISKMTEFQSVCERIITIQSARNLFKTVDFLSCSFNVLDHILSLETLQCDESVVLNACLDWARYKCTQNGKNASDMKNLREYLTNQSNGDSVLYKIRFGSIPQAEFLKDLDKIDGLFADAKEREDVMRLLLGSKTSKTGKFQTIPRNLWRIVMFEGVFSKKMPCSEHKVIQPIVHVLKTNQTVLLRGFYMVRMMTGDALSNSICFKVSIKEQCENGNEASARKKSIYTGLATVSSVKNGFVEFGSQNLIEMKPDCAYRIKFNFESDNISFLDQVGCDNCELRRNGLIIQIRAGNDAEGLLIAGFEYMKL